MILDRHFLQFHSELHKTEYSNIALVEVNLKGKELSEYLNKFYHWHRGKNAPSYTDIESRAKSRWEIRNNAFPTIGHLNPKDYYLGFCDGVDFAK